MNQHIVIIGGMGPQASIYLHQLIIERAATLGAKDGKDYPAITHLSVPVDDFISHPSAQNGAYDMIAARLRSIPNLAESNVVIACNTAHLLLPQLRHEFGNIFVSLIDVTTQELLRRDITQCGIMATPTTIQTRLYADALAGVGITAVVPPVSEQVQLEVAIRAVIATDPQASNTVIAIRDKLYQRGAEVVLLGCTELSVLLAGDSCSTVIDPLQVLVRTLLKKQ